MVQSHTGTYLPFVSELRLTVRGQDRVAAPKDGCWRTRHAELMFLVSSPGKKYGRTTDDLMRKTRTAVEFPLVQDWTAAAEQKVPVVDRAL